MTILLVEANEASRHAKRQFLQSAGYVVDEAQTLNAASTRMTRASYEFVLLAQKLPDGDGLTLLREATRHGQQSASFILFMSSAAVEDRLRGFAAGADACLPQTVALAEVACRLRSIARQRLGRQRPKIAFGTGFVLDLSARELRYGPHAVALSRNQFDLLHHLLVHRGQPVSRQQLGSHIGKAMEGSNFIDVHIRNVRKALARYAPTDFLQTVRGIGYQAA